MRVTESTHPGDVEQVKRAVSKVIVSWVASNHDIESGFMQSVSPVIGALHEHSNSWDGKRIDETYSRSLWRTNESGLAGYPGAKASVNPGPTTMSTVGGNLEPSPM